MTEAPPQSIPPAVGECLQRVHRILLGAKYQYIAGDPDAWPLAPVQMVRGADSLFVVPWLPGKGQESARIWEEQRRQAGAGAGLLLVGAADVDDPEVRAFFDATGGTAAYLDAQGGRFRLRRKWTLIGDTLRPLQDHNLRKLLDPSAAAKVSHIDCVADMRRHVHQTRAAQEFFRRAGQASGLQFFNVTAAMVIPCLLWFVYMVVRGGMQALTDPSPELVLRFGGLYGPLVKAGQWWRIFSCALVHIGWVHLVFNLYALYVFGSALELIQGGWRTALFFLFSVACGAAARLWWGPAIISAGASGGIFGLIGALLAVLIRHRREFPKFLAGKYRSWLLTVLILNAQFMLVPGIDWMAHLGGLAGGFAIGMVLSRSPVRPAWPALWTWPALAALVLGACIFAHHAVARIPASLPAEHPAVKQERQRRDALPPVPEFEKLLGRIEWLVEETEGFSRFARTGKLTPKEAAAIIRQGVLPELTGVQMREQLLELAGRISTEDVPIRDPARNMLASAEGYCLAALADLEAPSPVSSSKASAAYLQVLTTRMELVKAVAMVKLDLAKPGRSP